jgi:guanylate kinase
MTQATQTNSTPAQIARKGLMLVLSSPSGAGKTTISRKLLEAEPELNMSISVTTRTMRPAEINGVDYHFVDHSKFDGMVAAGEFLEHAEVFGNKYGTPAAPVRKTIMQGGDVLFDIDWQGTEQLEKTAADDVVSVFILPPNMIELEERLRKRAQDPEEVIQKRMSKAAHEISHWNVYDYVIINHNVDESVAHVQSILYAERQKRERLLGMNEFVKKLIG